MGLAALPKKKPLPHKNKDKDAEDRKYRLFRAVQVELDIAMGSFPPFNSLHEAFSVMNEEVDELWTEVKKKQFVTIKASHNPRCGENARMREALEEMAKTKDDGGCEGYFGTFATEALTTLSPAEGKGEVE